MRYIDTEKGLLLAPRQHFSHRDIIDLCGVPVSAVHSAGFLKARYEAELPWETYGESAGLGIKSAAVRVPEELWSGLHKDYLVIFSSNPDLLSQLTQVEPAIWCMSNEGPWGAMPVYAPSHPHRPLHADEILRD